MKTRNMARKKHQGNKEKIAVKQGFMVSLVET